MKGCYCPNCGMKQKFKLDAQSKVAQPCHVCGRPLLAKNDKSALTVKVYHPHESGNTH